MISRRSRHWNPLRRVRTTWLLATLFLLVPVATGADQPDHSAPAEEPSAQDSWLVARPDFDWSFPRDHWPHEGYRTEWWYLTGELRTAEGRRFGYQFTLFRVGLRPGRPAQDSDWRSNQLYMGHIAISDIEGRRHHSAERFSRAATGLAGAQVEPLRVWLGPWSIRGTLGSTFPLRLDAETDDRYLRYLVARLAAYRNVWWSLANEFDFMTDRPKGHRGNKQMEDWDRFFQILQNEDPHSRMRGIHNGRIWYDHTKAWVTHASLQTSDMAGGVRFRQKYQKPVIFDECKYEGNIPQGWGNLDAKTIYRRTGLAVEFRPVEQLVPLLKAVDPASAGKVISSCTFTLFL